MSAAGTTMKLRNVFDRMADLESEYVAKKRKLQVELFQIQQDCGHEARGLHTSEGGKVTEVCPTCISVLN